MTKLSRSQKNRLRLRFEVLRHYSGDSPKCAIPTCGVSHIECLSIDHINGRGNKHKKTGKFTDLTRWLKKQGFPPGYRVLCHNCNQSIGHYGYSPFEYPDRAVKAPPSTQSELSETRLLQAAQGLIADGLYPGMKRLAKSVGLKSHRIVAVVRDRLIAKELWPCEVASKAGPHPKIVLRK